MLAAWSAGCETVERTPAVYAAKEGTIAIPDVLASDLLEMLASRPDFVGAALRDEGRVLVVSVFGDPVTITQLVLSSLPAGTGFEIRVSAHSLLELQGLADRIAAQVLAGPGRDANVTWVDVDELQGSVVVGVKQLDDQVRQDYEGRFGAPVRARLDSSSPQP